MRLFLVHEVQGGHGVQEEKGVNGEQGDSDQGTGCSRDARPYVSWVHEVQEVNGVHGVKVIGSACVCVLEARHPNNP